MTKLKKGMKVKYTSNLGALQFEEDFKFIGSTEPGDTGVVVKKHPSKNLEHWWMTKEDKTGYWVPVTDSMVEVIHD